MMAVIFHQTTGVEELLDSVEAVLIRDINAALAEVYERRRPSDEERAARRGEVYTELTYDEVPPDHFHSGNFPSQVIEEVPPEAYPYIVLTVDGYTPDPEDPRNDMLSVYNDALTVHCLASATEEEGSEVVFRRAVRMGEAVYLALISDSSLRSSLTNASNPVRGQQSLPWTYNHQGHGEDWWFQAVGTSYAIKSYTSQYD